MEQKKSQPTISVPAAGLFPLGYVVATPGAVLALPLEEVERALARHAAGDWGEVVPKDWQANELALAEGGRLLSVYRAAGSGERFYVITEADRSATTLLLPEEY